MVGLYSLWVRRGAVLLLGAVLRASSALHHVYAPVSHAVPSIIAQTDSAEVVLYPNDSGIRFLGDISPHYAGIWEPNFTGTALPYHVVSWCEMAGDVLGLRSSTARLSC